MATVRIAIATLLVGDGWNCALPMWCAASDWAAQIIGGATLVVLTATRNTTALLDKPCGNATNSARFVQTPSAIVKAAQYMQRRHGLEVHWQVLLKFAAFGLDFDLVLFADLDVLLAPPESDANNFLERSMWDAAIAAFLNNDDALVSASPDMSSPVNTGLMLLKPHPDVVELAVALMKNCTWTKATGFDRANSPRSRGAGNLTRLAWGTGLSEAATMRVLSETHMWKHNTWEFVGGRTDQGLMWELLYLRMQRGTWAASAGRSRNGGTPCTATTSSDAAATYAPWPSTYAPQPSACWRASHFWGTFKPWQSAELAGPAAVYLWRLFDFFPEAMAYNRSQQKAAGLTGGRRPSPPLDHGSCLQHLARLAFHLQATGKWKLKEKSKWTRFIVLPTSTPGVVAEAGPASGTSGKGLPTAAAATAATTAAATATAAAAKEISSLQIDANASHAERTTSKLQPLSPPPTM